MDHELGSGLQILNPTSMSYAIWFLSDRYLASEPNPIEVIIIRSTRTVFNFYLAILLLKRM